MTDTNSLNSTIRLNFFSAWEVILSSQFSVSKTLKQTVVFEFNEYQENNGPRLEP